MNAKIIPLFLALSLSALACGFTVNLPESPKPSPETTDEISVPLPDAEDVALKLSFGAGELKLAPGAKKLVEGTATYNYSEFKPVVKTDEGDVNIRVGDKEFNSLPALKDLKNEWDFKLGDTPMELTVESGAYKGDFELGGLSLESLVIRDGAADVELAFSEPNPVEMSVFRYETGASDIKMTALANANFSIFDFSGGAGNYIFDFSGALQRDASVKIASGFSNIIISVPEGVDAVVTVEGGASNVNAGSTWSKSGDIYKQKGEGPTLTFVVEIGAGNLTLTK
ncbi:MAG: toast rack family protein [Chloroflexi bacterium]|nr:toast rack family protein [Chloroflexota bacterium]MCA2001459.1 toast rack family protein [Chloroflexota bacterium]